MDELEFPDVTDQIIEELLCRAGFDEWWDAIDENTQDNIMVSISEIIRKDHEQERNVSIGLLLKHAIVTAFNPEAGKSYCYCKECRGESRFGDTNPRHVEHTPECNIGNSI